jgi:hypothetical protein
MEFYDFVFVYQNYDSHWPWLMSSSVDRLFDVLFPLLFKKSLVKLFGKRWCGVFLKKFKIKIFNDSELF